MSKKESPPTLNQRAWNIINQLGFNKIEDFIIFVNKNGGIPNVERLGEKTFDELRARVEFYNKVNNINIFNGTIPRIENFLINYNASKPIINQKVRKVKSVATQKVKKDNTLTIDFSNKSKPFKMVQLSIYNSLHGREVTILNSASQIIFRSENKSLRSIGNEINISGERVRQLRVKIEKKVKNQTRKLLENNPILFNDSVYFEKKWSSYFIINIDITSAINEVEGTTFSQYFLSFILHLIYKNHIVFSISCNSNIFIHERCFKYPNLKKVVSSVIKGKDYTKYIEYEDKTIERLIVAISNELVGG